MVSACEAVPALVAAAREVIERDDLTAEPREEIAGTLSTRAATFETETAVTMETD